MSIRTCLIVATLGLAAAPALANGDPEEGEKVFRKCKSCHQVGEDADNRTGPALNGIVGAAAGQNPDFRYSDALKEAAANGLVWNDENLAAFLRKPKDLISGTKMSFAGLRKDDDIEDVIAYLATFE
jgi:cytochrome c